MKDNSQRLKRRIRGAYGITTVSVSLVLFMLGSIGYLITNAMKASNSLKESMEIMVLLDSDVAEYDIENIAAKFEADSAVKEHYFISKEDAAVEYQEYLGEDFIEFLGENPLPDSYQISINSQWVQSDSLDMLEARISKLEGVDELVYQRAIFDQVGANVTKLTLIMLLFGGGLIFISTVLLGNTIRMMIYSKRHLITTMKLVGASDWFILRPFLGSSLWQGFLSGVISSAMFFVLLAGIRESLNGIDFVVLWNEVYIIVGAMVGIGMVITTIFTWITVAKFVKIKRTKIELYG